MISEAWQLLSSKTKAAFSQRGAVAAAGGAGTIRSPGAGSTSGGTWQKMAEERKSKALQELVKLIGLEPIKKEMFNLADQVSCAL